MALKWLNKFHQGLEKPEDYAEKTLAAYRLGMKAKGSIDGVTIDTPAGCCAAAAALPEGKVYHPDVAPRLPIAGCTLGRRCACVYRPAMRYQNTAAR